MYKIVLTCVLFSLLISLKGLSQLPAQPSIPGYTYHPISEDKPAWQRLNMFLGATFLVVVKEGQVDLDSCLLAASRSMGLSRFSILAEGIDGPGLVERSGWIDHQGSATGIRSLSEVTGKEHLQWLLLLGAYYAFQPYSYYRHLDSVEYFLTKAIRESKSLKEEKLGRQALCLLVKVYAQGNDTRADTMYNALISQCRKAGDKETEAKVLTYRSKYTPPMTNTIKRKIDDAQRAAALYHSLGNTEGEIHMLTDLGYLMIITRQLQVAQENMQKALELAEAIHYPYVHYNTQALATVTLFQGKFGEPLKHVYQTIRTAEATRDSLAWSYFYTSMSQMLSTEDKRKEGFEMAKKSVSRFVADRNTSVYGILDGVVNYMNGQGQAKEALVLALDIAKKVGYPTTFADQYLYHYTLSDCYLNLNMTDEAEVHINKLDSLETLSEAVRGTFRRGMINAQFGFLYSGKKEYRKAREFFEKGLNFTGSYDASFSINFMIYRNLLEIDSMLGDNAAAVTHYKKYAELLDSSFRVTKVRQAEELQVIYQMTEKDNEIKLLKQQADLEKANSEKAALIRNVTIAGIIAVIIIAGLLYRQSRLRKRNNKVITGKNEQLQQLLGDKEWLLKEIHHRVKNNLQIVISLLDSQSEYIDNDAALAAIEDNMRRVHAMALIHQKLYLSDDISTIAMPEYINELVNYARESFDTGSRISFEQSIEPVDLDVSQAIPLGLIINECIVNAIKHAFPNGRKGAVRISFHRDGPNHLLLDIVDNGTGLQTGLNTKAHTSLGIDLMKGLTKQLNGAIHFGNNNGLHITIRFIVLTNHLLSSFTV